MLWAVAAGLVLAAAVPARAQVYPNIPPNTVLGRLGAGQAGPPQPVPITSLLANLAPLVINPPFGTATLALETNTTLPSTGSAATSWNPNIFTVVNPGYSPPGSGLDSYGLLPEVGALRVQMQTGVSILSQGLVAANKETSAAGASLVGSTSSAYSNFNSGSTLWGAIGFANVGASGNVLQALAVDAEVAVAGAATYRIGLNANSIGPNQGSTLDTAIGVQVSGSLYGAGGGAPFQHAITLEKTFTGFAPLASSGDVIYADGSFTTGTFANLPNVTFTTLFNFANVAVAANGGAIFGKGIGSVPAAGELQVSSTSYGSASLITSANGASGLDYVSLSDSAAGTSLAAGVYEASATFTRLGQTAGNWGFVFSTSSSSNGLLVGSLTGKPVLVGTNNTLAGFINSSQQWSVGSSFNNTPSSGTLFTISAQSGVASPNIGATVTATTPLLQLINDNTHYAGLEFDGFGGVGAVINGAAVGGTAASPTATGASVFIWNLNGLAYDGSAYGRGAAIHIETGEAWSSGHHGTLVYITGTPNASTSEATVATFQAGVQIGAPTGGDEGAGKINVQNGYYINGAAGLTQTCTVNQAKTLIFTLGILTGGTCNS